MYFRDLYWLSKPSDLICDLEVTEFFFISYKLYNFPDWQNGEYKALIEVLEEYEYIFKDFNICGTQVLIQIRKNKK